VGPMVTSPIFMNAEWSAAGDRLRDALSNILAHVFFCVCVSAYNNNNNQAF
jgi:hypothetical protein